MTRGGVVIITLLTIIIAQFDTNFLSDLGEVVRLKVESAGNEPLSREAQLGELIITVIR